jgi:PAS domain S-box-containing protein
VVSARRNLHVLISEDQEDDALLIVDELRQCGYAVTWGRVETSQEMRQYLGKNQCDLIIADYDLPRFSAMGALQILKESGLDIPFLIVSGAMREIDAVAGMRAGVHDYLSKDNLTRLGVVVERELREAQIRAERRQAELLLRRQAQVLEQVHDAVIQMDLQGLILKWNGGATRLFGYIEEETTGRSIDLIRLDNQSGYDMAGILREVHTSGRFEGELQSKNKYGEERWTNLSWSLLRDEAGEPYGIVVYGQDTTERREAELALRESEERYRLLMELLPQMIWVARREGVGLRIEFCNPKVLEYFGISMEQLYNGLWRSLIHPDDRDHVTQAMHQAFIDNTPFDVQYRLRRAADDNWRWHLARYTPFVGRGEEQRWISAVIDIEDNTRAEEALRKAEKLAAVGRIASSIAHEINNPLEAVVNLVYLLQLTNLTPEQQEYVQMAASELQRVSHITNHTLRFHRQSSHASDVNLAEAMDSVLALYRARMSDSGITIEQRYDRSLVVAGYPSELRQVFANLLSNAFDAMRQGGRIVLSIKKSRQWKSGVEGVRVSVADTGHGMEFDVRKRIFEPFFTTKGINGTGLGMWVSAELVAKHGGSFLVRSTCQSEQKGTVISIFFPRTLPQGNASTPGGPIGQEGAENRSSWKSEINTPRLALTRDTVSFPAFE